MTSKRDKSGSTAIRRQLFKRPATSTSRRFGAVPNDAEMSGFLRPRPADDNIFVDEFELEATGYLEMSKVPVLDDEWEQEQKAVEERKLLEEVKKTSVTRKHADTAMIAKVRRSLDTAVSSLQKEAWIFQSTEQSEADQWADMD